MGCGKTCKIASTLGTAIVLIISGVCTVVLWGVIYHRLLNKELTIATNSAGYNMWKETPIPMYLNVYLYNWTNADDVLKDWKTKPIFEQCGPYVFSERHVRVNLTWHENGTVTYQQRKIWQHLPDLSNGTLRDNITNLNVIAATVSHLVRKKPFLVKEFINYFMETKEKNLVITKTADEWLFSGYKDELLEMASKLNISGFSIPYKKFGWFYGRNNSNTYDGNFTMFTGETDLELLGIISDWNGSPVSSSYSSYCSLVNGTSGELWPPVQQYDRIAIFSSDLCSSLWISHVNDSEYIRGLQGKKFVGTDYIFDNGTKYPEQECFVIDRVFPSGVRDVSKCKFGAPAFVSYPHFYLADPSYRNAIVGMRPNRTEHEFYMILEPNTGIPLEVRVTMQINLFIEPIKYLKMFEKVKSTFVPMLWFSQTAKLTEKYAHETKLLLTVPSLLVFTGYGLIGLATVLVLAFLHTMHHKAWNEKESTESLLASQT